MSGVIVRPAQFQLLAASATAVAAPGDTSENTLATINVPAGLLGPSGVLRVHIRITYNSNANNKTLRARWSGAAGTVVWGPTRTTQLGSSTIIYISNRTVSSQVYTSISNNDASTADGNAGGTAAVNTAVATSLVISGQKTVAGDTIQLEHYIAEYLRA